MKYNGRGYILGAEPSIELWKIRPQNKYVTKVSTEREKKVDLSISKILMPRKLPPIKFEAKSQTKLKPKYLNKSASNITQPIIRRQPPLLKPPMLKEAKPKVYSPPTKSAKQSTVYKGNTPEIPVVIYESVDTRISEPKSAIIKPSAETLIQGDGSVERPPLKSVIEQRTIQLAQKFRQIEIQEPIRNRARISQMIDDTVLPNLNTRSKQIKQVKRIMPQSPTIDQYNNDKFSPEENTDKSALSYGAKFWKPSENDIEIHEYDPLPREYLEFSFNLSLPGCKSKYLSLEGDAPISNITSFIQRSINQNSESSKSNASEIFYAFSFGVTNESKMTSDADLGPWNTKLISDLGFLNSEIRVTTLEDF